MNLPQSLGPVEELRFKRALGGYVAETDRRVYVAFSGWGWREDLHTEGFIWTLEVRDKVAVGARYRTVVGVAPFYQVEMTTLRSLIVEAQRLEREAAAALVTTKSEE